MKGLRTPKPLSNNEVKALFLKELVTLLESGGTASICSHLCCILRRKNNPGKDYHTWTDSELLIVIQNYRKELKDLAQDKEEFFKPE